MHFLKSPEGYVFLWQYLAYELGCMVHFFAIIKPEVKYNSRNIFGSGILCGYVVTWDMKYLFLGY